MPLRDTVARMGAATGDRLSNLLHTLVFSLPTPDNVTGSAANATTNATGTPVPTGISVKELDSGLDPGVSRALATGTVGPLSFVGSGYGMMLVVMVSAGSAAACQGGHPSVTLRRPSVAASVL